MSWRECHKFPKKHTRHVAENTATRSVKRNTSEVLQGIPLPAVSEGTHQLCCRKHHNQQCRRECISRVAETPTTSSVSGNTPVMLQRMPQQCQRDHISRVAENTTMSSVKREHNSHVADNTTTMSEGTHQTCCREYHNKHCWTSCTAVLSTTASRIRKNITTTSVRENIKLAMSRWYTISASNPQKGPMCFKPRSNGKGPRFYWDWSYRWRRMTSFLISDMEDADFQGQDLGSKFLYTTNDLFCFCFPFLQFLYIENIWVAQIQKTLVLLRPKKINSLSQSSWVIWKLMRYAIFYFYFFFKFGVQKEGYPKN